MAGTSNFIPQLLWDVIIYLRPCYLHLVQHSCNKQVSESTTTKIHGVTWWRHQIETFSALLVLCVGNSPVTGEFPSQSPKPRSFDVFFDLRLNKRWINFREAGDLRRHRPHYDTPVMTVSLLLRILLRILLKEMFCVNQCWPLYDICHTIPGCRPWNIFVCLIIYKYISQVLYLVS